jgi:hypothetical protein
VKPKKMRQVLQDRAAEHAKKFDIHHIIPLYEKLYERFCKMQVAPV